MSEFTAETLIALVDEKNAAFQACDLGDMKSVNRSVKANKAFKDAYLHTTRLALTLHAELEQERAGLEKRVAVWKGMMQDSLDYAKDRSDLFVAMRSFSQGQADAFGIVLNDIHDLQRGVFAGIKETK